MLRKVKRYTFWSIKPRAFGTLSTPYTPGLYRLMYLQTNFKEYWSKKLGECEFDSFKCENFKDSNGSFTLHGTGTGTETGKQTMSFYITLCTVHTTQGQGRKPLFSIVPIPVPVPFPVPCSVYEPWDGRWIPPYIGLLCSHDTASLHPQNFRKKIGRNCYLPTVYFNSPFPFQTSRIVKLWSQLHHFQILCADVSWFHGKTLVASKYLDY